jgi:hypothetical protein
VIKFRSENNSQEVAAEASKEEEDIRDKYNIGRIVGTHFSLIFY